MPTLPNNPTTGLRVGRLGIQHALPFAAEYTSQIALWTSATDLRISPLPAGLWLTFPAVEFISTTRLAITDRGLGGSGPARLWEIETDYTNALVFEAQFGDIGTREGASCRLPDGSLLFAHWRDTRPRNVISFDLAYRSEAPSQGQWSFQNYEFESNTLSNFPYFTAMTAGPDGLAWLFFTRDSAGKIGLVRFRSKNGTLQLVDADPWFIPGKAGDVPDLSPSGEVGYCTPMHDLRRKRIILIYQSWPHTFTECTQRICSRHSITAVYPDKRFELLGVLDWLAPHADYPVPVAWPRPDSIYFIAGHIEPESCEVGWNIGMFDPASAQVLKHDRIQGGRLMAYSDDGWLVFRTSAGETQLLKRRFKPELSITRQNQNFIIAWDEGSPSDFLETSSDLQTWTEQQGPVDSPILVPNEVGRKYFRIRQGDSP